MINAEQFARAGFSYLGRSYDEMDCQEFFETCAEDCGLPMDLKGSNAWYRKFRATGWTGSPEDCKAKFGSIPNGAALFIHAFDGGEEKRGYYDGLGNASHIGIKTGTGKGAIHSSASRGCVAESDFNDKTIKNGGWNMVGLSNLFDYGEKINQELAGSEKEPGGGSEESGGTEPMTQKATVWAYNGQPVKMRQKPSESCNLYESIPNGETVDVVKRGETWTKINAAGRSGWYMKTVFLVFGEIVPDDPDNSDGQDGGNTEPAEDIEITVRIKAEDAGAIIDFLDDLADKIAAITGRG